MFSTQSRQGELTLMSFAKPVFGWQIASTAEQNTDVTSRLS